MPEHKPGQSLYNLYRANPPARNRGALHVQAYYDGLDGRPNKFARTSYGWWAYKAGAEARQLICTENVQTMKPVINYRSGQEIDSEQIDAIDALVGELVRAVDIAQENGSRWIQCETATIRLILARMNCYNL